MTPIQKLQLIGKSWRRHEPFAFLPVEGSPAPFRALHAMVRWVSAGLVGRAGRGGGEGGARGHHARCSNPSINTLVFPPSIARLLTFPMIHSDSLDQYPTFFSSKGGIFYLSSSTFRLKLEQGRRY